MSSVRNTSLLGCFNRRAFLGGAAASFAGTVLLSRIGGAWATTVDERAAWSVGIRDSLLATIGAKNCWDGLKAVDAEAVELELDDELALNKLVHPEKKYSVATPDHRQQLMADAQAAGIRLAALCMRNRFASRPDFEVDLTKRVAEAAEAIGCRAIRLDVVPEHLDRAAFLPVAVDALRRIVDATGALKVRFGIENHGKLTNDPEFLDELFEKVGSDRLGLTLDTANFYWFGHPLSKLYEIYEHFAPRVFHTHCKSIAYPEELREQQRPMGYKYREYYCPIDRGDIDFAKVIEILRKADYRGMLCIENESLSPQKPEESKTALIGEIKLLKRLRGEVAGR